MIYLFFIRISTNTSCILHRVIHNVSTLTHSTQSPGKLFYYINITAL